MDIIGHLNDMPVKAFRPVALPRGLVFEYKLIGDDDPYMWRRVAADIWRSNYRPVHSGKTRDAGSGEVYIDDGKFMKAY